MKVISKTKCVSLLHAVFGMDKPSNFNKIRLKSHKDDHLHLIRPNLELDVSNVTKRVKFKTDSDGLSCQKTGQFAQIRSFGLHMMRWF